MIVDIECHGGDDDNDDEEDRNKDSCSRRRSANASRLSANITVSSNEVVITSTLSLTSFGLFTHSTILTFAHLGLGLENRINKLITVKKI